MVSILRGTLLPKPISLAVSQIVTVLPCSRLSRSLVCNISGSNDGLTLPDAYWIIDGYLGITASSVILFTAY